MKILASIALLFLSIACHKAPTQKSENVSNIPESVANTPQTTQKSENVSNIPEPVANTPQTLDTQGTARWQLERIQHMGFGCSHDDLEPTQAEQRTRWWARCFPNEVSEYFKYFDNFEPIDSTDTYKEAVEFFLFTPKGKKRPYPKYPSFGCLDTDQYWYWTAPADENAPCHKPDGVYTIAICTSRTPKKNLGDL